MTTITRTFFGLLTDSQAKMLQNIQKGAKTYKQIIEGLDINKDKRYVCNRLHTLVNKGYLVKDHGYKLTLKAEKILELE